jgi:hypothetical protein
MTKKRAARDYYSLKSSRYRRILELAMSDTWKHSKRELRAIYAALQGPPCNYNVLGYRAQLEMAIKYVKRAEKAIKALENDDEN